MKRIGMALIVFILLVGSAAPLASAQTVDESDVAKMYLVQHELKMKKNASTAWYDGKALPADPFLLRNGRTFVPIKLVRDLGIGTVEWDNKTKSVHIQLNDEYLRKSMSLRVGKPYFYGSDGTAYNGEYDIKIPAPFLYKGRTYLPVRAMEQIGISVGYENGVLFWRWSEKIIEILKPRMESNHSKFTFSVLYEKDLYTPQYMLSGDLGGWSGYTGQVVEKDIKMDNRTYNRIQFTAELHPGINPVMLTAISMGNNFFEVMWEPKEIVPVNAENDLFLELTSPTKGYFQVKKGQPFTVAGLLKELPPTLEGLRIDIGKYSNYGFSHEKREIVNINNLQFSTELVLNEPGYYYVEIVPQYPLTKGKFVPEKGVNFYIKVN